MRTTRTYFAGAPWAPVHAGRLALGAGGIAVPSHAPDTAWRWDRDLQGPPPEVGPIGGCGFSQDEQGLERLNCGLAGPSGLGQVGPFAEGWVKTGAGSAVRAWTLAQAKAWMAERNRMIQEHAECWNEALARVGRFVKFAEAGGFSEGPRVLPLYQEDLDGIASFEACAVARTAPGVAAPETARLLMVAAGLLAAGGLAWAVFSS